MRILSPHAHGAGQSSPSPRATFPRISRKGRNRRQRAGEARELPQGAQAQPANPASDAGGLLPDATATPGLWPIAAICATACLSLLLVEFAGSPQAFLSLFPAYGNGLDSYWVLRVKAWWVASILVGYVALPAIVMCLLPGKRLRDCHLSWRGFAQHYWLYVGLYGAVLPVIWLVSQTPAFYTFYPMYPQAGRSWFDLLMWEGMYAGQFIALEFFFRGFLVGGLSRHNGALAVPVSVIPYMMIHFTKPWPEAAASVVAGFVLGWLAWKTKSIWGGVCVHCAVAATMDLLALAHKGQLPWLNG